MDIHKTVVTPSREIPIPNKRKIVYETYSEECGLKNNCFDPNKTSPPNSWTSRLIERLEIYSSSPQTIFSKRADTLNDELK